MVPDKWAIKRIGQVTEAVIKVDPSQKPSGEFVYLDISSIDNSTQRISSPKKYLGSEAPSRARQLVRTNDVLFSTVRTYLKNIALVPELYDQQIASTGFSVLRASPEITGKYIFYFVQTDEFLNPLNELQRGTSYPAVRDGDVRDQFIPLPPLVEQERIVERIESLFSQLDAGVAALKRAQANLKRYKAAVLKAACEGRLVPQNPNDEPAEEMLKRIHPAWAAPSTPTDLPKLPQGWCWAKLREICNRVTDGTHLPPKFENEGIPFLFVSHIVGGKITFEKTKFISRETYDKLNIRCPVVAGDILYTAVGSYGVAVLVETNRPFSFQRHIAHIKPSSQINHKYLSICLNSDLCVSQAHLVARGVAQKTVTLGDLSNFILSIPPRNEQDKIVDEVERRMSVSQDIQTILSANLSRAARLRQSILKLAFEGRLVEQAGEMEEKIKEVTSSAQYQQEKLI